MYTLLALIFDFLKLHEVDIDVAHCILKLESLRTACVLVILELSGVDRNMFIHVEIM